MSETAVVVVEPSRPRRQIGPADPRKPWEQWPRESTRAYRAFTIYRDMGVERSQQKVGNVLAISRQAVGSWSVQYKWVERVYAWEVDQQRKADARAQATSKSMVESHGKAANALRQLAVRGMQPKPLLDRDGRAIMTTDQQGRRVPVYEAPDMQDLGAAGRALDLAIKHERLAAGLPTDVTRQDVLLKDEINRVGALYELVVRIMQEYLCDDCRQVVLEQLALAEQSLA